MSACLLAFIHSVPVCPAGQDMCIDVDVFIHECAFTLKSTRWQEYRLGNYTALFRFMCELEHQRPW